MVVKSNRYRQGKSHEWSRLGSHYSSTSYGGCGPTPRPPGLQLPPYEIDPACYSSGYQATDVHQYKRGSSPLRSATITMRRIGVLLVFLAILAQAVAFFFFYDLPTKLGDYSKATARMREQQDAMRREARHLESERDLLEREKGELRKEREKLEKAREDRVPQGAFWAAEPWPALNCRAYGKREYWAELQNIPEDWTDLDACMNMPTTIKDVFVRRPDRCGYVAGSPHIHGFWMVDWDQIDCQPWHIDVSDKVSSGQPT